MRTPGLQATLRRPAAAIRHGGMLTLLVAVALLIGGCGSLPRPSASTTPRVPAAGDLRFKQVDAPSVARMGSSGGPAAPLVTGEFTWYTDAIGSPLDIGPEACEPGVFNCAWGYFTNDLPPGVSGLTTHYQSLDYQGFGGEMQPVLSDPSTVLTCLDFEPGSDAYAAQWIVSSQATGFDMRHEAVPPSQIQAAASQDGLESRVITAVSFDAQEQANLFSYGLQSDTATVYEVQTTIVSSQEVPTAAAAMAGDGYIITAFGGNDANGYLLVGTRVHGDILPRPMIVETVTPNSPVLPPGELNGYAPVVCLFLIEINTQGQAQWNYTFIFER